MTVIKSWADWNIYDKINLTSFSKDVKAALDHVMKQLIIVHQKNLRVCRTLHLRGFGKLQNAKFNFEFNLNWIVLSRPSPWWSAIIIPKFCPIWWVFNEFLQRNCCQNSFDRCRLILRAQLMSITDPLTAIALEMASMDQDEIVEDSAEVYFIKFQLPAVSSYCRLQLYGFDTRWRNERYKV